LKSRFEIRDILFKNFPAMLETGLSAVVANASNAVALYPGRFPSV